MISVSCRTPWDIEIHATRRDIRAPRADGLRDSGGRHQAAATHLPFMQPKATASGSFWAASLLKQHVVSATVAGVSHIGQGGPSAAQSACLASMAFFDVLDTFRTEVTDEQAAYGVVVVDVVGISVLVTE